MTRLFVLLVLIFAGCSGILTETESGHAGVMTETETGMKGALVFENGDPAEGAVVALLSSPEDNPLAKGSADTLKTITTDSAGQYLFKKLTKGRYSISAYCYRSDTKDTLVAHQSGIDVVDSQITDAGTSTLLLPGKIRSRVLAGGAPVEGALCYIMDQKDFYLSLTDGDGVCIIHNVSPGTYTVTFQKDAYLIQDVPGVDVEAEKTADAGDVLLKADPDLPPPRPQELQAAYDADSGTVSLSWLPVDVSDIDGYIIFRDDSGSTSETRITEGYLVTDSFFVDTVYLALSGFPAVLRYRIKAQDQVGDKSTFSEFEYVTVTAPNRPVSPLPEDGAFDQILTPMLAWTGPAGGNGMAVVYDIYLDTVSDPQFILSRGQSNTLISVPYTLEDDKTYFWKVVAYIDGNSVPGPVWSFTTLKTPPDNQPPAVPSSPSPENGALRQEVFQLLLTWSGGDPDAGDEVRYDIFLDTKSAPAKKVITTTDTFYVVPALANSTDYFWQVVASDGKSLERGPVWQFKTRGAGASNTPPEIPSIPNPANDAVDVTTVATLSWTGGDADGDSVQYSVFLGMDNNSLEEIGTASPERQREVAGLANTTKYYWRVTASDGQATSAGGIWTFTTKTADPDNHPPAVDLVSPADGASDLDSTITFQWLGSDEDPADALEYSVYVDTANLPLAARATRITDAALLLPLEPGQTYYWRVLVSDGESGVYSSVRSFSTRVRPNLPPEVSLLSPVGGVSDLDSTVSLVWEAADPDVTDILEYTLLIDTQDPPVSAHEGVLTEKTVTLNLQPGRTYYWQIRASDGENVVSSNVESFSTAAAAVTLPELVAYWDFNEASGTSITDKSGNGNHGTLYGSPVRTQGVDGNGLALDGVNDYALVPTSAELSGMMQLSVTAWIQVPETPDFDALIYKWGPGTTSDDSWGITLMNDNWSVGLMNSLGQWTPSTQDSYQPGLQPGKWVFLAFVYDGTRLSMYTNGDDGYSFQTISGPLRANTEPIVIGAQETADAVFGSFMKGVVDEVKVYRGVLTREEIQAEWTQFAGIRPDNSALAAWYPFSGSALDFSANQNDGVVTGAALAADRFGNANSAYHFDGIDDVMDCGGDSSLNLDGKSFTLSVWAKLDAAGKYHTFMSKGDQGVYNEVLLYSIRSWNDLSLAFYGDDLDVPFTYSTGTWYHLVVTYDVLTGMRSMYVNGAAHLSGAKTQIGIDTQVNGVQPSPGLSNTDGEHLLLGKRRLLPGGELPLYGTLDDVRIYTRILSASEIQSLYGEGGWTGN